VLSTRAARPYALDSGRLPFPSGLLERSIAFSESLFSRTPERMRQFLVMRTKPCAMNRHGSVPYLVTVPVEDYRRNKSSSTILPRVRSMLSATPVPPPGEVSRNARPDIRAGDPP